MTSKLHLSYSRVSDIYPAALSYLRGDLDEFKAAGKQQARHVNFEVMQFPKLWTRAAPNKENFSCITRLVQRFS